MSKMVDYKCVIEQLGPIILDIFGNSITCISYFKFAHWFEILSFLFSLKVYLKAGIYYLSSYATLIVLINNPIHD